MGGLDQNLLWPLQQSGSVETRDRESPWSSSGWLTSLLQSVTTLRLTGDSEPGNTSDSPPCERTCAHTYPGERKLYYDSPEPRGQRLALQMAQSHVQPFSGGTLIAHTYTVTLNLSPPSPPVGSSSYISPVAISSVRMSRAPFCRLLSASSLISLCNSWTERSDQFTACLFRSVTNKPANLFYCPAGATPFFFCSPFLPSPSLPPIPELLRATD